jgi:phosphoketolase
MTTDTLTPDLLHNIDAYWRAANYLSVGQIYLHDNPLLRRPLIPGDAKHMLLGHWGTTSGQNFVYAHNRVINARFVCRTMSARLPRRPIRRLPPANLPGPIRGRTRGL